MQKTILVVFFLLVIIGVVAGSVFVYQLFPPVAQTVILIFAAIMIGAGLVLGLIFLRARTGLVTRKREQRGVNGFFSNPL